MKQFLALITFLFLFQYTNAQKEASIWYFGFNAGLDFNSGVPVALNDGELYTYEGCATISDFNGNLLFYTDGIKVWNRNHQIMPNGTGLYGNPSSSHSGIIIPKPNDPNIYYLFTADAQAGPRGINYSEINMTLDGGLGDVTSKNIPLIAPGTEKLTAVMHANKRDIWVITHGWRNDQFHSYLVTPTGVDTTPATSYAGIDLAVATGYFEAIGTIKVSPNGKRLAICHDNVGAEVLDFDDATGMVSNPIFLSSEKKVYGVEFSPSSEILYLSIYQRGIYQIDLNAANVSASALELMGNMPWGALQQGIDGKIYITYFFAKQLGVIHNPDILGLGSNYEHDAIDLGTGEGILGLPPFVQSFFLVNFTATNLCFGDTTEFNINVSEPIISILWDFGDGNTSTVENATHIYTVPGDFTVNVTVTTATETKTESKDITIYDLPTANTVTDYETCSFTPTYTFDLSTKDTEVLGVQFATENTVSYFPTLLNAQNGTNALPLLYTNTDPIETIFTRISNKANPDCFDTASFDLIVKSAPLLNAVNDWTICDTDTDGQYDFDLSLKDTEVLNGQNQAVFTVAYFESQADADAQTNAIGPTYTNTTSPQQIYFRIGNAVYPECQETGSFTIEVLTGVTANTPTNVEVCDDNNDGIFVFDLSTKEAEILGIQNASTINVFFHSTLLEAENGTNPLYKNAFSNTSSYQQTLYARVENKSDPNCYDTTSFDLIVRDAPTLENVTSWQICDSDNNGVYDFDLHEKDLEILGNQSLTDFSLSYHVNQTDALTGQNPVTGIFQNTSNPQTVFYRLESTTNSSCFLTDSFTLVIFDSPIANTPRNSIVCDNNGTWILSFDLSTKDVEVLDGQSATTYEVIYFGSQADAMANLYPLSKTDYANSAPQETIFARIQNRGLSSCFDITSFGLIVNPLPRPQLEQTYVICPDSPELSIDGGDFETWLWQDATGMVIGADRTIVITGLGNYSLTVARTLNGVTCENKVPFEVAPSGAPEDFTTTIEGFSDTVTIVVDAMGVGDFEYSIDGENFQGSNRLAVFPGVYTVYVRDLFLCRTLDKEVIALGYQKFFTPNGDGSNEHWHIIGAENYPESRLYIYDRYSKLLQQLPPTDPGWDGTLNGLPLPSSDYWFRYVFETDRVYTGHFSLKR